VFIRPIKFSVLVTLRPKPKMALYRAVLLATCTAVAVAAAVGVRADPGFAFVLVCFTRGGAETPGSVDVEGD
jgi:hypothetical protein